MNKKINLNELYIEEEHNILNKKNSNNRKINSEKLSAQIKVNLREIEKEKLKKIANHNISAFVRDILIKHGLI